MLSCDFNGDGLVDIDDVNALTLVGDLTTGVAVPQAAAKFDLNNDGIVNGTDLDQWLADAAMLKGFGSPYLGGDANLDGDVDVWAFDGSGDAQILSSNLGGPAPNGHDVGPGQAEALYDPGTGELFFDVGTAVAVVGIGCDVVFPDNVDEGSIFGTPVQNDDTSLAFFNAGGLPVGEDSVGLMLPTGLVQGDIAFSYTPIGGDTVDVPVTLLAAVWSTGDFNGDGDVDIWQFDGSGDAQVLSSNLGSVLVTPPGAFGITGPSTLVADTTPTITWDASDTATSYDVTISTDPAGTSVVQSHLGVTATSLELTSPLVIGTYYAHVVANNDEATTSATNNGLEFSVIEAEATIDTVYFAQTHVQKPTDPYFSLVSNRDALIKAHVVAPGSPVSPEVVARLTLGNQTLDLPLTGPATLPASISDGPGVVQHSFDDSFTATIPAAWMHPDLDITITADTASVIYNNLDIGAPTVVEMTMFDIEYFEDVTGDYPAGTLEEIEAKWPVADLVLTRVPNVVFSELVIPARGGAPAVRVASKDEYFEKTGLNFDGEQAAALAWNGALKRAAGRSGRVHLSYVNIYGVHAGGQAGGFAGVGSGTSEGILHHELGHALSLPHWGNSSRYPYKGDMYGISAPDIYNETHVGPTWGFDPDTQTFIPPTAQPNNVSGHPAGTYKADPMQGGGKGWQEPQFLLNHFSDYSVWDMQDYLESHVLVWNDSLNRYASWNQANADYTNAVSNNGVQYPVVRDVDVITVMASILGADPDVNMVYPPIGAYEGNMIDLFDPRSSSDRAEARQDYGSSQDFDVSLRITQGGAEKVYMLPARYDSTLRTEAVNLPTADGEVTQVELLLTPDAQVNGLPADPQVLYTWSSASPAAGTEDSVEYLFTETDGSLEAISSDWQYEYESTLSKRAKRKDVEASVDLLLATDWA